MQRQTAELEAGLDHVRAAPADGGRVELIVRRPAVDEREVLEEGELDLREGLVGDSWRMRELERSGGEEPDTGRQLNLMNARAADLVAVARERWALAGDQLFLDLDLSAEDVPPGTRLALGSAVIEVTEPPHNGCKKFRSRFGLDALKLVSSPVGKELKLRGVCARVVTAGTVRRGDPVRKVQLRTGSR